MSATSEARRVVLEDLHAWTGQPRGDAAESVGDSNLVDSVSASGILVPLLVRRRPDGEAGYQIIAGERRYRAAVEAARMGSWPSERTIPVQVFEADDESAMSLALLENLHRLDLHWWDSCRAAAAFVEGGGRTRDLAARLGVGIRTVQMWVLVGTKLLPESEKLAREGLLTLESAREIARYPVDGQEQALRVVIGGYLDFSIESIRRESLSSLYPTLADCFFEAKLYKGVVVGSRAIPANCYLVEREAFDALQTAAIAETVSELEGRFDEVVRINRPEHTETVFLGMCGDFVASPDGRSAIVVTTFNGWRVKVFESVDRGDREANGACGKGRAGEPSEKKRRLTKRGLAVAAGQRHKVLVPAIQRDPSAGLCLAALKLIEAARSWYLPANSEVGAQLVWWDEVGVSLGEPSLDERFLPDLRNTRSASHQDGRMELLHRLRECGEAEIFALMRGVAAVSARCDVAHDEGVSGYETALANAAGVQAVDSWDPREEELLRYSKAALVDVAIASGAVSKEKREEIKGKTMKEIARTICTSDSIVSGYRPPELRWGPE